MLGTGRRATCEKSPAFPASHREDVPRFNRLPREASPCGKFISSASSPATGHQYAIVVMCKGQDDTRPSSDPQMSQIHERAVLNAH